MPRMTDKQYHDLLRDEGGFSIHDPTGEWPESGVMVSRVGSERSVSGVASPEQIGHYRQDYAGTLSEPGVYFGGWKSGEGEGVRTDLDHSDNLPAGQSGAAHEEARRRGQEATFDLDRMKVKGDEYGGTQVEHGPKTIGGYRGFTPDEARDERRAKNTAYRHSVREHIAARQANPQTHEEVRAAGERIGGAVYEADQVREGIEARRQEKLRSRR